MKKLIAILVTLIVLTIAAVPLGAQTRDRRSYRRAAQTRYDDRYDIAGIGMTNTFIKRIAQSGISIATKSLLRGAQ